MGVQRVFPRNSCRRGARCNGLGPNETSCPICSRSGPLCSWVGRGWHGVVNVCSRARTAPARTRRRSNASNLLCLYWTNVSTRTAAKDVRLDLECMDDSVPPRAGHRSMDRPNCWLALGVPRSASAFGSDRSHRDFRSEIGTSSDRTIERSQSDERSPRRVRSWTTSCWSWFSSTRRSGPGIRSWCGDHGAAISSADPDRHTASTCGNAGNRRGQRSPEFRLLFIRPTHSCRSQLPQCEVCRRFMAVSP